LNSEILKSKKNSTVHRAPTASTNERLFKEVVPSLSQEKEAKGGGASIFF
jgi:hypothetical protein